MDDSDEVSDQGGPGVPASTAVDATAGGSEFIARMSHEIRTPLNVVLGMLDLALKTELTGEQREYLRLMKSAGGSLLAVVNDILDFSRIESGQLELEETAFSLRGNVGEMLKMLGCEARKKGLMLNLDIAPAVPDALLGDPMRLRQILVNLVGNAIKFSGRGEVLVRVDVEAEDGDAVVCRFSVADQGIGISREQQAALFSPYRQAARSTARLFGGSGLGLSIAARLVSLMQGHIWVDSAPGRGSVFHFNARFARACGEAPAVEAAAGEGPTPGGGLEILLVEDDPMNRRLAQIVLEKAGHRVRLAGDGQTACQQVARRRPDVVLMDVQMPGMDGFETAAAIRADEGRRRHARTPIIALTADVLPGVRERCRQAGMDGYIAKPVDPDALLAALGATWAARPGSCVRRRRAVLDRRELLRQVDGDRRLLREIRQLFVRDSGPLLARVRQAMVRRDSERLGESLHTLRGMFRSLSAPAALEAASLLETVALAASPVRAEASLSRLEREIKALKAALSAMAREGQSPRFRPGCAPTQRRTGAFTPHPAHPSQQDGRRRALPSRRPHPCTRPSLSSKMNPSPNA